MIYVSKFTFHAFFFVDNKKVKNIHHEEKCGFINVTQRICEREANAVLESWFGKCELGNINRTIFT